MNGDLISREALKKAFEDCTGECACCVHNTNDFKYCGLIDDAPPVEPEKEIIPVYNVTFDKEQLQEIVDKAIKGLQWIPITYRPLTEEERIAFADHYGVEYCDTLEEKAFDCPMPEDGQEILISTSWGVVEDVADNDIDGEGFICYGLETNGDWDGVEAWMPKPERYKKEGAK